VALRLANFYGGLATLLRAGVVAGQALDDLRKNGTLPDPPGAALRDIVASGEPLSTALRRFPDAFPEEDVAVVEAGEATGRLDGNLQRLARHYEARAAAIRSHLWRSLYPVALGHFAALIIPVSRLAVRGELTFGNWLRDVLAVLVPCWGLFFAWWYLRRFAVWRARFRKVVERLPGFGAAARHRRRALFASVLEAAYEAGVPVDRSLALAARAAGDTRAAGAADDVAGGQSLTVALTRTGLLGSAALERVATGEEAGEVTEALRFIAQDEAEQADEIFKASVAMLSTILYVAILGLCAWYVISFYVGLYSSVL